jgi:hypothetical protein
MQRHARATIPNHHLKNHIGLKSSILSSSVTSVFIFILQCTLLWYEQEAILKQRFLHQILTRNFHV